MEVCCQLQEHTDPSDWDEDVHLITIPFFISFFECVYLPIVY